jgi:hypothetical protein
MIRAVTAIRTTVLMLGLGLCFQLGNARADQISDCINGTNRLIQNQNKIAALAAQAQSNADAYFKSHPGLDSDEEEKVVNRTYGRQMSFCEELQARPTLKSLMVARFRMWCGHRLTCSPPSEQCSKQCRLSLLRVGAAN